MQWAKQTRNGFTIVELLIVVVVIAILATITIIAYTGIQTRARDSSRDAAAKNIRNALEMYKTDNNEMYPNGCGVINNGCNSSGLASLLVPKYISSLPSDPLSGTTIDYVVGAGQLSYGLLVRYESKPVCKFLGGASPNANWWGASVAVC